ncbi:HAMP domain-containing sensor histidine kinase [Methylopila sp. 73B]|uniref:sensor histidine kinase n=1 Tax=Methylopila sp. 73B TaxID=1120792 RepID=UPI00035DB2FC|nr:HAMP domain-containing sensor histidine kinase [Methylopila sp. 73B]
MADAETKNPSLWWRLSWQLSLVFVVMIAILILGLAVYGSLRLSPNIGLKNHLAAAIEEALDRDAQGRLIIDAGPRLDALKTENEKLWFVVVTTDGEITSYGATPAPYLGLAPYARYFRDADIRGDGKTNDIASIDVIETPLGEVRVLYGGNTSASANILTLLSGLNAVYVPLLLLTLPAVFATVPRIIRKRLEGLQRVVNKAPEIDPHRPGSRLPLDDVPKEVVPLIVAFNSVLARLEEQFQVRQRFLIDAAHELRTPIAIMQTRIEGMPEGQHQRRLLDDVARLGEMAEQLLDFERQEHDVDHQEMVDLVDIARDIVADLAPLAIGAGYEITFDSEVERLERKGSPSSLPRAISNLVRNAIDHGGNRGTISVTVTASGEIVVADHGGGIPPDQQDLIFEPFYRVTPRSRGAGLGLSLVRQIVDRHRGQVLVTSSSSGSAFTLRL